MVSRQIISAMAILAHPRHYRRKVNIHDPTHIPYRIERLVDLACPFPGLGSFLCRSLTSTRQTKVLLVDKDVEEHCAACTTTERKEDIARLGGRSSDALLWA